MRFHTAFTLLIAGLCTFSGAEANFVTDQIVAVIEDVSASIRDRGLDPLNIKREAGAYALPVPVIFNAAGFCEEVLSTGLSNIIINDINYDVLAFRLTFDIEMPHIQISVEIAAGEAVVFDNKISGEGSGSLDIYNARVRGDLRIGVLGGVSIRSAEIDSSIAAIDSNLYLNIQGYDLSGYLNNFIGGTILNTLEAFKPEVDELISILLINYVNENILG